MSNGLNLRKWDIWQADVPYMDDFNKSSVRPVLIVEQNKVLVLKITTHGHSEKPKPYEYEVCKWKEAGLTAQSYIQCDRFIELEASRFTGKHYGTLSTTDIIGVMQMARYHGLGLQ